MIVLNNVKAPADYTSVIAKAAFCRRGDYQEYINLVFEGRKAALEYKKTWIEPGVFYRVDARSYTTENVEYFQDLEVGGFAHILCLDWDWGDIGHKTQRCVTITSLSDVIPLLEESGETWRVYITPGGVRAFCTSKGYHPEWMLKLGADPLYINLCKKTNMFWFRLVPKGERPWDWVAEFIKTVGEKPADLEIERLIQIYHDQQVVINRGYKTLSPEQQGMINDKM